jgi:hypothetical protein
MTFRFSLTLLLFVSLSAFSQPTVKPVKAKSRYLIEQYEVLAANDTVRHGQYRRYFREDNVLLEEGQYADNKRTGVWTFYDGKGKPELVYDYSTKTVLANNRVGLDSMGIILLDGNMTGVLLTPPPIFLASQYQTSGILARESKIPLHLIRAGQSELSFRIAVTVSSAGATYRIMPSYKDKNFVSDTKKLVDLAFNGVKWIPGQYDGKDVTAVFVLPAIMLRAFATVSIQRH